MCVTLWLWKLILLHHLFKLFNTQRTSLHRCLKRLRVSAWQQCIPCLLDEMWGTLTTHQYLTNWGGQADRNCGFTASLFASWKYSNLDYLCEKWYQQNGKSRYSKDREKNLVLATFLFSLPLLYLGILNHPHVYLVFYNVTLPSFVFLFQTLSEPLKHHYNPQILLNMTMLYSSSDKGACLERAAEKNHI